MTNLEIPCSYQGGKQRLAKQIVDIIYSENKIDDNTKFYDLCCGSGAVSLELINRGFNPNNIIMIDKGVFGQFWQSVANDEFEIDIFKNEIDKIPSPENIQEYLSNLSNKPITDVDMVVYHYLLLQAGAFGSKQVWIEDDRWVTPSFRSYWLPTKTSNRKSPVNPMMPMPKTLYNRVENIVSQLGGCIVASKEDVFKCVNDRLNRDRGNIIVYIDPPYYGTTGYECSFDVFELIRSVTTRCCIDVSEGCEMKGADRTYTLSTGRAKGNITGDIKKKPTGECLNKFQCGGKRRWHLKKCFKQ